MPKEMDEFLNSLEPEEPPAPEVVEAPEAPVETQAGSPPPPPPEPPQAPAPAEDDEPVPEDERALMAALRDERTKRRDHKGRADKLEGELAAIRAELDAARKAPPPPPPVAAVPPEPPKPPRQIPHPVEDPEGYHQYWVEQRMQDRFNDSERLFRRTSGFTKEDIDEKIAAFKKVADTNPALQQELLAQVDPYEFAYNYARRLQALAEVGDDPNAFRTKVRSEIEAELRAKILAEMAEGVGVPAPAAPPVVQLPGSLSNARSTGGRVAAPTAPGWDEIWDRKKKSA